MNTITTDTPSRWALLILPLFLALPCFFGYSWAEGDLLRQFYPWKELARQALQQGRLPLWNDSIYCGMPLFGNFQSGLAYPPHLPFYFLNFSHALGLHLLFHFFISGLGVYALMRALRMDRFPALLGALCWQGNAFLLVRVEFLSALSAYAWTPWMLWAVAANATLRRVTFLVAMQALAGYPLELAYSFGATFLFAFGTERGKFWRLLGGWALGLGVAALVLMPGIELILASDRLENEGRDLLKISALKAWIWPFSAFGWKSAFSLALPAIFLAAFARGRTMLFSSGLMVLGLGLSFGALSSWIPNRHPTLALVYCALGLAMLSSLGAQTLALKIKNPKSLSWIYAASALLLLGQSIGTWMHYGQRTDAALYQAAPSALDLKKKMTPGTRFLASPSLQDERESPAETAATSWKNYSLWLHANTASVAAVLDANGYDPLAPAAVVNLLNAVSFPKFAEDPWLLDLLGVETLADWDKKRGRFNLSLSRRKGRPMRAFMVEDKAEALLFLNQGIDAGKLDKKTRRELSARASRMPVELIQENPEALRLILPPGHPSGWVFLNDTHYPGWRAKLDGVSAPIQLALGAFRAVHVEKNSRELEMRYSPTSFYLGLIFSLIFLFMIFFW